MRKSLETVCAVACVDSVGSTMVRSAASPWLPLSGAILVAPADFCSVRLPCLGQLGPDHPLRLSEIGRRLRFDYLDETSTWVGATIH